MLPVAGVCAIAGCVAVMVGYHLRERTTNEAALQPTNARLRVMKQCPCAETLTVLRASHRRRVNEEQKDEAEEDEDRCSDE